MARDDSATIAFLETVHPYDSLPRDELARVAGSFGRREVAGGGDVFTIGTPLEGLYLVREGAIEVRDGHGATVSVLGPRNSFGERGLMREGLAVTHARASEDSVLLLLPGDVFHRLLAEYPAFERYFNRGRSPGLRGSDLATLKVGDLMNRRPVTCAAGDSIAAAAKRMRDAKVSSLGVLENGKLWGVVTTRDLSNRVLAEGRDPSRPVREVATPDPITLPPSALGSDILNLMLERGIGHVPVVEAGEMRGMITHTDLTRFQAINSAQIIREVAAAGDVAAMGRATARIPQLLVQLVAAHNAHEVVTRLVTDVADAVTRRLLALAEAELGPPPVPYLWLACGSQGRQEQTGVSDQDNCLFLDDSVTDDDMPYFERLARFVCDGLDEAGYYYCPGDMMATNPRWRQPVRVWRQYFRGWIESPVPEAQMLASVMFDLRPIGGEMQLFSDLHAETLAAASRNSIFVAHMISNALKHAPPLGLLRGFATIRSGEYKNHVDMKLGGVIPIVDLGRVYALRGRLADVNTRARLVAAGEAGVISQSGARDLLDAYDLIAEMRLKSQAALVRSGRKPDNYLAPADLSDFDRSHLRDAFVVVRTMQSAVGHGRGTLA